MTKAKSGDTVEVHYTGTLDTSEVFDSSEGKDPLKFTLGSKQVIPGFEDAIEGMEVGEEKEVHIEAKDAYGERNEELVQIVPKDRFGEFDIKVGMIMAFRQPGIPMDIPARIIKIEEEGVTVDINPPLAGKNLNFKIKLVNVETGKAAEDNKTEEKSEIN